MASYKFTPAHPTAPWRVYHRGRSFWCHTEAEAKEKMETLNAGKGAITAREIDEYRHAREILMGVPLLQAVRHYVEHLSGEQGVTVAKVVAQHMKAASGRADYLEKKAYFLGKLTAAVGELRIGAVKPSHIEQAIVGLKSDWVRNDFLKHARILFRYAIKMRLTRNDPTAGMEERKVKASKVILTLADTEHLLATCASALPDILPAMALQLFAGIRTSEVMRLAWDAVKAGEWIDIGEEVAKTHERRVIDWWPPRLTGYVMTNVMTGTVVPYPDSYEHHKWELIQLCRKSKKDFAWGQNAPRHSFASYAVAHWQDAGRVALWMGQRDVNILFRHYRNYRTQAEGSAYFGCPLAPSRPVDQRGAAS